MRVMLAATVVAMGMAGAARASSAVSGNERGIAGSGVGFASAHWGGEDEYQCSAPYPPPIQLCVPPPVALTVQATDSSNAYVNLCADASWCYLGTAGGPLWNTLLLQLECSIVDGNTWYGGASVAYGGPGVWWSFKIVDGTLGVPDEMGINRPSPFTPSTHVHKNDGACGARGIVTTPVVGGGFHVVDRPQ